MVQPGTDKPLVVRNQKGKELKYRVLAREGHTAKHAVESTAISFPYGPCRAGLRQPSWPVGRLPAVNEAMRGAGNPPALRQSGDQVPDLVASFGLGQFLGCSMAPGDQFLWSLLPANHPVIARLPTERLCLDRNHIPAEFMIHRKLPRH